MNPKKHTFQCSKCNKIWKDTIKSIHQYNTYTPCPYCTDKHSKHQPPTEQKNPPETPTNPTLHVLYKALADAEDKNVE